jgi:uncharacterized protein YecT (DUF1311 family)
VSFRPFVALSLAALCVSGCAANAPAAAPRPSVSPSATPSATPSPSARPPAPLPLLGVEYPGAVCDPKDDTTMGMASCAEVPVNAVDRKLDAAFRALRAAMVESQDHESYAPGTLSDAAQVAVDVDSAQRTWILFRDAQCTSESDEYFGGSITQVNYPSCLAELGLERLAQLRRQLHDQLTEG